MRIGWKVLYMYLDYMPINNKSCMASRSLVLSLFYYVIAMIGQWDSEQKVEITIQTESL